MDEKELKEIFDFLQKAGANPQLCDTEVPHYEASVRAGFPTENWAEQSFVEMMSMPRKMLSKTPAMIVDVDGDSMVDAGISDGDLAVIDRAVEATHGDVIVAYVNEEFTIKFLDLSHQKEGYIELRPANPKYRPIRISADDDFEVWGVVVWTIKPWKR